MTPKNNISQELLETIERYINKNLTSQENNEFKKKLLDPEFKAQFEDIKTLVFGIETQSLKEQLDEFHKEIPKTLTPKKETTKVWFLQFGKIAAAAAIIIALGSFWYFGGGSNKKLYNKHFSPDPGLPTVMSETANFEFYDAMVNYKQGDYNTAISKWEKLLENKPKNDTLNYFLGVAHLANKNEESAINHLHNVTQNSNTNFKNEAHYYLGLAYLKSDNVELAKKNLNFSTIDNSKKILLELND